MLFEMINQNQSFSKTKTIAFVLFPEFDNNKNEKKYQNAESKYYQFKNKVERSFSIPVFLLGQKNNASDLLRLLRIELEH